MGRLHRDLHFFMWFRALSFTFLLGTSCGETSSLSTTASTCSEIRTRYKIQVYDEPDPGSKVLFLLDAGQVATVLDYKPGSFKILNAQGNGWIEEELAQCLSFEDISTAPDQPPFASPSTPKATATAPTPTPKGGDSCLQSFPATWPVPSKHSISKGYGVRSTYMDCKFHTGIDISSATGTKIVAAGAGKVVHVGNMWLSSPGTGRGKFAIIIDHGGGLYSTYSHNSSVKVKTGDCVRAGDNIAAMGSLGYSSGPHLHFELLKDTRYTGSWSTPFSGVCSRYANPSSYL